MRVRDEPVVLLLWLRERERELGRPAAALEVREEEEKTPMVAAVASREVLRRR